MDRGQPRLRLDEILIHEGLVSEDQVREALLRQKAHGGKFGSQLLYHRYIDEAGLVKALSIQFGCEGVILSDIEIPGTVIKMIPGKVALARRAVPFAYEPDQDLLRVACENPLDPSLISELKFVTRGKNIELHVAAELALNTAIARYYLGSNISLDDNLLLEIPDEATAADIHDLEHRPADKSQKSSGPKILLITDEIYAISHLEAVLKRDNFRVLSVDSLNKAEDALKNNRFHTVLIKDDIAGDFTELLNLARRISPGTAFRYYKSAASLILNDDTALAQHDLLLKNLDLFTCLLSFKANRPANHGGRVGQYVDRLCQELRLAGKDRLIIDNAAYVHNLASFYYNVADLKDSRQIIHLTIKMLAPFNYSPVVMDILRNMYTNLQERHISSLPLEILGSNILTIVDLFCSSISTEERLSLDKFEGIAKKLRDLSGKLILPEVVEAFTKMIRDEILDIKVSQKAGQALVFAADLTFLKPLEWRLGTAGFRIAIQSAFDPFIELYRRSEPDLMILAMPGIPDKIRTLIDNLEAAGVGFERIPTFILTETSAIGELTSILDRGIEDIIAFDNNLDLLMTKIRKVHNRLKQRPRPANGYANSCTGAHGRLAEINLIDLFQALGPGRKTAKITVQRNQPGSRTLIIYLDKGGIKYAQCDNLSGVDAIYEGLRWTEGLWLIEPISSEEIPHPNIDQSNESILMEGCRLIDEMIKTGHLL